MPRTSTPAKPAEETAVVVAEPKTVLGDIGKMIDGRRDQLIDLFGDEAMVDRMKTLTLHALAEPKLMEKLQKADVATVIDAIRQCASLGLMPIPALAEGYFVPYWNADKRKYDLQFQPGYNGLAKLVLNSGRVLDVDAGIAYEHDLFEYEEGSNPFVRHVRVLKDRGERIAAYAVARMAGGIVKVRVLDIATIEKHRKASKASKNGPWVDWYDPMAQKTALRELLKYLPKSPTVEKALILEAEAEERYATPPALTGGSSSARGRLRARFGADASAAGDDEQQGATTTDGKERTLTAEEAAQERTLTAEEAAQDVSVDPGASETVEGVAKELPDVELCGATSDPALGDPEPCVLEKDHAHADGSPTPHQGKDGSRWPNR
jgi:phage RecT family recombinase